MNMVFRAILAFALLVSATVEAGGSVSIWKDDVTVECPSDGSWWKMGSKESNLSPENSLTHKYQLESSGDKSWYQCRYNDDDVYNFYILAKSCKDCFELETWVFAVVILADVIGTAIIMTIVYKCSKKTSAGQRAPNASRSRGENIPLDRTYEPLASHTRSDDYSVIHRTG